MNPKTISIVGCGWFGLPLAEHLMKVLPDTKILGSTTHQEKLEVLNTIGIDAYLYDIYADINAPHLENLWDVDVAVINIPPGLRKDPSKADEYIKAMQHLAIKLGQTKATVILVSSTSVYADESRVFTEDDIQETFSKPAGEVVYKVEELFGAFVNEALCVLRFAGLFAEDRHPGRFFAGKTNLDNGQQLVNMTHREDCIKAVEAVIKNDRFGEDAIYNICGSLHPTREAFYTKACEALGLETPHFKQATTLDKSGKIIDNKKAQTELGLSFEKTDRFLRV